MGTRAYLVPILNLFRHTHDIQANVGIVCACMYGVCVCVFMCIHAGKLSLATCRKWAEGQALHPWVKALFSMAMGAKNNPQPE